MLMIATKNARADILMTNIANFKFRQFNQNECDNSAQDLSDSFKFLKRFFLTLKEKIFGFHYQKGFKIPSCLLSTLLKILSRGFFPPLQQKLEQQKGDHTISISDIPSFVSYTL